MPHAVQQMMRDLDHALGRIRLAASKALRDLSKRDPEVIYPEFDKLAALLDHENNVLKWNAILTLAYFAPADREGKLDHLLHRYLAPISGPTMITAANTIKGAAIIARAKPALAAEIADGILRVEKAKYATPECRNVAIGHALQALLTMRGILADTREVHSFAARQVNNPRPATAKKAARLLASLESASKSRSRS
jgi:hypothetical protein